VGEAREKPDYYPSGARQKGGWNLAQALVRNVGTCRSDDKGEVISGGPAKTRVPKQSTGADGLVVAQSGGKPSGAKEPNYPVKASDQPSRKESKAKTKSFCISKWRVFDAYKRVKANKGGAGIDGESLQEFEQRLKDNLYKIWNRMSSGSYFPPPVKEKEIDKKDGGKRKLGIPTVGDRVAQMVVKMELEPLVEPRFHQDSYGYRPNRSAHQALEVARKRNWQLPWVIDVDIRSFFDTIDHEIMMEIVQKATECRWTWMYIKRWLKAPMCNAQGEEAERQRGTPQGGVISPMLANMYLNEAFDKWMDEQHPGEKFVRYADDIVIHCRSEEQAKNVLEDVKKRLQTYGLQLHPEKTKIVYCNNTGVPVDYPKQSYEFLGYTYRLRRAVWKDQIRMSFLPAISRDSELSVLKKMREWSIPRRSSLSLNEIAREVNVKLRGWLLYYGRFYKSALQRIWLHFNGLLMHWAMRKYKKLSSRHKAIKWLQGIHRRNPRLFVHWERNALYTQVRLG